MPEDPSLPLTVIINKYKTYKKYGKINEKVTLPLSKLIREYITRNKIQYGDFLFGKAKKQSAFVSKMNKSIGETSGVSIFRHMKASEYDNDYRSPQEKAELAYKMKHSGLVNLAYVRKIKNLADD